MKTYYAMRPDCELSSGGWCFTHSTGDGPIYCVPLIDLDDVLSPANDKAPPTQTEV